MKLHMVHFKLMKITVPYNRALILRYLIWNTSSLLSSELKLCLRATSLCVTNKMRIQFVMAVFVLSIKCPDMKCNAKNLF